MNTLKKILFIGLFLAALAVGGQFMTQFTPVTAQENATKQLRHVVLFKFKAEVSPAQVKEVADAFASLPKKISTIQAFEWGTDVSVENKSDGFTHCFVVTFRSAKDRDEYIPHAAHQEFVKLVGPRLEKVLVVDYWANK